MLDLADGTTREIGITRLHLEQDAGKSLHDQHPSQTYVDLNRAGVALMEIVSEPDMRSAEEAGAYLRKLRSILRYLGTCDGNMEEGSLRCDCNVSVRQPGGALGTRCEIKNVNSIRFVMQAIDYEARRQIEVIEEGGTITQETRLFDAGRGITRPMRSKEEAHDYRYFPDPDLLPLVLDRAWVEELARAACPNCPTPRRRASSPTTSSRRTMRACSVPSRRAPIISRPSPRAATPSSPRNWVMGDLFGALNKRGVDIEQSPVSAAALGRAARSHRATARSRAGSPRMCSPPWSRPARAPRRSSRSAACAR